MNTGHSLVISDGESAIRVSDMGSEGSAWGDAKNKQQLPAFPASTAVREILFCVKL